MSPRVVNARLGDSRPLRRQGTRGMPRPERERSILDVAGGAFARGGYHSASMDEIAELAGVSKPMIYAYFGSKEGLYVAYIDRTGRELLDRLVQAGARGGEPLPRLRARIDQFLSFVEQHRDAWTVLYSEMTSSEPLAREVAAIRGQIAQAVGRMLADAAGTRSKLSPSACEGMAHAIVGAGESLANWWLEHPRVSRAEVADWYVALVQAAFTAVVHDRSP